MTQLNRLVAMSLGGVALALVCTFSVIKMETDLIDYSSQFVNGYLFEFIGLAIVILGSAIGLYVLAKEQTQAPSRGSFSTDVAADMDRGLPAARGIGDQASLSEGKANALMSESELKLLAFSFVDGLISGQRRSSKI